MLIIPLKVHGAESSGSTAITTRVPDTHTVLLDIGNHGYVVINGTAYSSKDKKVEIARLKEQTYTLQADEGWVVDKVSYGNMETQEVINVTDNEFLAPAIYRDDNALTVTFKKDDSGGGTITPIPPESGSSIIIPSGDSTNLMWYVIVFMVSLISVVALVKIKSKSKIDN